MFWMSVIRVIAIVVMLGSAGANAQEQDDDMLEAWKDALGDQEPVLTTKQFALLNNLAFQAAATKICEDLSLDAQRFEQGLAEATSPAPPDMSETETEAWEAAVLMRFGMTYGLLLAEGNDDKEDFCASANELRADSSVPNVWR